MEMHPPKAFPSLYAVPWKGGLYEERWGYGLTSKVGGGGASVGLG